MTSKRNYEQFMNFKRGEKKVDYNCALYIMDNEGAPTKRVLKSKT
jgi:hypothetical protein